MDVKKLYHIDKGSIFRICLITGGSAALERATQKLALKKGRVFFTFPDKVYERVQKTFEDGKKETKI